MRRDARSEVSIRCSFCHKGASKLISAPSHILPKAYICDNCVVMCAAVLEDDREPDSGVQTAGPPQTDHHPLLDHPLASQFLAAAEQWVAREAQGVDARDVLREMRRLAQQMASVGNE